MRTKSTDKKEVWYARGLRFRCTSCGNCCTGVPGYVDFSPSELEAMARYLGLVPDEFLRRYARRRKGWWTLREIKTEESYDCIFLQREEETGRALCSIYEVRPSQCRTWPFWPENLESREAWETAAESCPGMEPPKRAKLYRVEEIRRLSEQDGNGTS